MKITIFAATGQELMPIQDRIAALAVPGHTIRYCITGVGMLQSAFYIQRHLLDFQPQLLLQVGIAGCFDRQIPLGTAIVIEKEYLGSLGVVENNTKKEIQGWQDIFDLGLQDAAQFPFDQKALTNPFLDRWPWLRQGAVKTGAAVTIDEISTDPERIDTLKAHYQATVESMEGAALHFNGLMYQIPFLQIRGISNYIAERDKTKWQIGPAIQAVRDLAIQFIRLL